LAAQPLGDSFIYPAYLDGEALKAFIPHRGEMLFARSVTVLSNTEYTGTALWEPDSVLLKGHFPGQPIVPGVMVVEAGAQIAAAGLRAGDPVARHEAITNLGVLMAIRKCFFRKPWLAGNLLHYELQTRQISHGVVNVTGQAICPEGIVASLEFTFAQVPHDALFGASTQLSAK
jgi:3-hydroxyacyl-[acyl-carrier-protein] dehydratase